MAVSRGVAAHCLFRADATKQIAAYLRSRRISSGGSISDILIERTLKSKIGEVLSLFLPSTGAQGQPMIAQVLYLLAESDT
jgi:hypothetical protein